MKIYQVQINFFSFERCFQFSKSIIFFLSAYAGLIIATLLFNNLTSLPLGFAGSLAFGFSPSCAELSQVPSMNFQMNVKAGPHPIAHMAHFRTVKTQIQLIRNIEGANLFISNVFDLRGHSLILFKLLGAEIRKQGLEAIKEKLTEMLFMPKHQVKRVFLEWIEAGSIHWEKLNQISSIPRESYVKSFYFGSHVLTKGTQEYLGFQKIMVDTLMELYEKSWKAASSGYPEVGNGNHRSVRDHHILRAWAQRAFDQLIFQLGQVKNPVSVGQWAQHFGALEKADRSGWLNGQMKWRTISGSNLIPITYLRFKVANDNLMVSRSALGEHLASLDFLLEDAIRKQ
jgi:hypothetical protein